MDRLGRRACDALPAQPHALLPAHGEQHGELLFRAVPGAGSGEGGDAELTGGFASTLDCGRSYIGPCDCSACRGPGFPNGALFRARGLPPKGRSADLGAGVSAHSGAPCAHTSVPCFHRKESAHEIEADRRRCYVVVLTLHARADGGGVLQDGRQLLPGKLLRRKLLQPALLLLPGRLLQP